jgi:hypothetical protein
VEIKTQIKPDRPRIPKLKSHSPKPVRTARANRGRKPATESRAAEIRARLIVWKQTPESSRSSLRALAAEIGTSHQLLSFYLRRLDRWQGKEQAKEYERRANDIRTRARVEQRPMTGQEHAQVEAYTRAFFRSWFDPVLRDKLTTLRKMGSRRKLSRVEQMIAKLCGDG